MINTDGRQNEYWTASPLRPKSRSNTLLHCVFSLCSIVYIVVSQNTLFPVIPFHNLSDCDLYTPPVKERQNDQPGYNEELVTK